MCNFQIALIGLFGQTRTENLHLPVKIKNVQNSVRNCVLLEITFFCQKRAEIIKLTIGRTVSAKACAKQRLQVWICLIGLFCLTQAEKIDTAV